MATIFSLVDQIFSNKFDKSTSAGVLISNISDHFITFPRSTNRISKHEKLSYRDFSKNSINLFKNDLSNISWNSLYSLYAADEAFNNFWQLLVLDIGGPCILLLMIPTNKNPLQSLDKGL